MLGPPGQARRALVLVTAGDPRAYGTPASPELRKPARARQARIEQASRTLNIAGGVLGVSAQVEYAAAQVILVRAGRGPAL
jgi:hypothetical protein